jgi:thioredoxin-related protein
MGREAPRRRLPEIPAQQSSQLVGSRPNPPHFPMMRTSRIGFPALFFLMGLVSAVAAEPRRAAADQPRVLFVQTSVEQGWKSAVAAKKPLLVMFTSDGCMFCEKMLSETYRHPAIERMLVGHAETVLAHSRDYKALAKKLGVRGYPSTLLVSPEGEVLDFMEGYVDARAFADRVYPLINKRTAQADDPSASVAVHSAER